MITDKFYGLCDDHCVVAVTCISVVCSMTSLLCTLGEVTLVCNSLVFFCILVLLFCYRRQVVAVSKMIAPMVRGRLETKCPLPPAREDDDDESDDEGLPPPPADKKFI